MKNSFKSIHLILCTLLFLGLAACGGGGGTAPSGGNSGEPTVVVTPITLGGAITGLNAGATVVLRNGSDILAVNANGKFRFPTALAVSSNYAITVASQPTGQICTVSNGVGAAVVATVDNVKVICAASTYSIGVSVIGLTNGQILKLQNNGADTLSMNANGIATFSVPVTHDGSYAISVLEQPVGQTCTVSNASGAGVVADVSSAVATCSTKSYAVGGTATGLATGQQVSLWINGSDALTLYANGAFTFVTKVAHAGSVVVSIATQPIGQICSVSNGILSNTIADVSNIQVVCSSTTHRIGGSISGLSTGQQVTLWNNGADALLLNSNGTFQFSTPVAFGGSYAVTVATQPLAQRCEVVNGVGASISADVSNVKLSCTAKVSAQFTWAGGSNVVNRKGYAPTLGAPSMANIPGARNNAASWTDVDGDLWLFGGWGYDLQTSLSGVDRTYDLWKLNPASGEWTSFGRSATYNYFGNYGVKGVADAANWPAVRQYAASWSDSVGNLWLFGGDGPNGKQNDLWKYTPSTGLWTWISGSNVPEASSVYGTRGVAAASNTPGARFDAATWTDAAGNLWLFGGAGVDDISNSSPMDDLWKFNPTSGFWTWMGGSNTQSGRVRSPQYGTKGVAAASNFPGIRSSAVKWTDLSGNFWLFGGVGSNGNGFANDLWKYSPTTGLWTWVSGGPSEGVTGVQGYAAPANVPGTNRRGAMGWRDSTGNLWLFAGLGGNAGGSAGLSADLWKFNIVTSEWAWVRGPNAGGAAGVYGALGVTSATSTPGARAGGVAWTDNTGQMWLFGGIGSDSAGTFDRLNDLWKINPSP